MGLRQPLDATDQVRLACISEAQPQPLPPTASRRAR